MANEISNAVKVAESALPSGLTWIDAFKSHADATLALWEISGRVACNDKLTPVDRLRLADKIVKTSTKEENTMPKQTEAGDAMTLADNTDREYILAAAKHRRQLQQSDTESVFDIAARLKETIETKRAADAKKPADATLSDTDRLALHRPGYRLADARRKKYQQWDPEGRESGTITEEDDDNGSWSHDRRRKAATAHVRQDPVEEEALSDACERARNEYIDRVTSAYKNPR